jgi:enoyl-CoA hydratase/carnithine racemase
MGYIYMNREDKYNVLSLDFIKELRRMLISQECDEELQFILLTSVKGEVFCGGADLKCEN